MAWPYSPLVSYTDGSTPGVTSAFLNQVQAAINTVAVPGYERIRCNALSVNQTTIVAPLIEAYITKDAATSQYIGVPAATAVSIPVSGTSTWQYVYVTVTNGVPAYSVSTTAPESTKRWMDGTETARYLFCYYVDSYGYVRRFRSRDGEYTYAEQVFMVGSEASPAGLFAWPSWVSVNFLSPHIPSTAFCTRLNVIAYQNGATAGTRLYIRAENDNSDYNTGCKSMFFQADQNNPQSQIFETGVSYFQYVGLYANIALRVLLDGFSE